MTQLAYEATLDDKTAANMMKLQARIQELEGKLRSAGGAGKKMGAEMSSGVDKALSSVANLVTGYLSLRGGIQAVSQSLATYVANMEEAATVGDKFAASVRGFAFEAGGGSRAKIQQIRTPRRFTGSRNRTWPSTWRTPCKT